MSDDSREYFESVAHKWEEMRRTFFGEGVRDAAIAAADINSSSIVVDVGIGTGFIAEGALAAGARVIGVDSSDHMLKEARQRFGVARFEARSGDIESLPVGTGEVDVVLEHLEDGRQVKGVLGHRRPRIEGRSGQRLCADARACAGG